MAKVVKGVVSVIGAVASVLAVIPSPIQPIAAIVATVATVASTALNAIAPSKPKSTAQGSQTSFKLDPQSGIPYVIGRTLVGGNAIHRDTWGTDNEYQGFAVVWSGGGPVDAIEQFQCDQTGISFDGASKAIGGFKDFMWLKTQLGVCPSPALTSPVAGFPGWGANSKLSGYAAGVWITKFDKKGKKYAGGLPRPGAIIRGVKVYDPRQDSTYPGGSGACRALQENTYVYSENPWLHALTWALGRWQNGVKVLGVGMAVDQIAVASFVDAANIADANSWKAGGTVSSIDDKWEVLKMLAQAGGGQCIRLGAKLTALIEAPRVAIATIRETDLVGKATISATQFQRSRINGVVPIYRSEAHGWEQVPADVVRYDTYVTEDGGRRTVETELVLVQQIKQAAELTSYEILNSREFGPIDLELKIQWLGIEPGDLVNLDIPSAGLAMQPSLALTRGLDPGTGNVALSLRSETASKHAVALGKTTTVAASPSLVPPDLSVVPAPGAGSWTVAAGFVEGPNGSGLPILVARGATDNPNASNTVFEYRPVVAPVGAMPGAPVIGQIANDATGAEFVYEAGGWARRWLMQSTQDAGVTVQEFGAVTPQTSYQIAVSYVSRGVLGDRRVLGPVVTGQLIASNFAGAGALATASYVRFGDGTIRTGVGGTATDAGYQTALGTAAAIAGQADWATYTGRSTTDVSTRVSKLQSDGSARLGVGFLLEENATYWITNNAAVTSLGTAAAIAGQGSLATANQAAYGSQISGLPAALAPANLVGGNALDFYWIRDYSNVRLDERWPAEGGANVTGAHTAAAIAGQADWATYTGRSTTDVSTRVSKLQSDGSARLGVGFLLEENATYWITNNAAVTSLGTAAAIAGQADWATYTGRSTTDVSTRVSKLQSDGSARLGVGFLLEENATYWITNNAAVTSLGTAAAIAGQADWATYGGISTGNMANRVSRLSGTSGRVVDPTLYNSQMLLGPSNTTNLNPTYTVGGSNVTVNLPAHSRKVTGPSGPITLSYGAMSGTVAFSTYWTAYIDDPDLTGIASPTATFTSNPDDLLYPGRYQVASGVTPNSGGSGGGAGGGGGGGGGWDGCVDMASHMPDGRLAGACQSGDMILSLDDNDPDTTKMMRVTANSIVPAECVELVSATGIRVIVSITTPCTLRTGECLMPNEVLGHELAVLDDQGFRWERIVQAKIVGLRNVAHISCNEGTYAAGAQPGRFIFTHNGTAKP